MNNAAAYALADLLREYGKSVANTPRSFETLLRQKAKGHPGEIAVLLTALSHDIVRQLSERPKQNRDALGSWLHYRTKLPELQARWAVEAWAAALGVAPPLKPDTDVRLALASSAEPPAAGQSKRILLAVAAIAVVAMVVVVAYLLSR